jgi:hypothetical protein
MLLKNPRTGKPEFVAMRLSELAPPDWVSVVQRYFHDERAAVGSLTKIQALCRQPPPLDGEPSAAYEFPDPEEEAPQTGTP